MQGNARQRRALTCRAPEKALESIRQPFALERAIRTRTVCALAVCAGKRTGEKERSARRLKSTGEKEKRRGKTMADHGKAQWQTRMASSSKPKRWIFIAVRGLHVMGFVCRLWASRSGSHLNQQQTRTHNMKKVCSPLKQTATERRGKIRSASAAYNGVGRRKKFLPNRFL